MTILKHNLTTIMLVTALFCLNACTYGRFGSGSSSYSQAEAIKSQGGMYKVGNPYKIMGRWYYPKENYGYSEVGMASWYGSDFHAKKTANGENYDMMALTAAHRTLPLPSIVKVTNLENGRSLVLRVNDRGPYAKERIIDISKRGAQLLGFQGQGTAKVRVELLEDESKALKSALTGKDCPPSAKKNAPLAKSTAPSKPMELSGAGAEPIAKNKTGNSKGIAYPKGSFFVQAGAYSKETAAQTLGTELDKFGSTNIFYVTVNGQQFYRVRLGPYAHRKEAEVALAKVNHHGVYNAKVVQD